MQITSDLSKAMVCPHGQGGRGVREGGEETIFLKFHADIFYRRLLI